MLRQLWKSIGTSKLGLQQRILPCTWLLGLGKEGGAAALWQQCCLELLALRSKFQAWGQLQQHGFVPAPAPDASCVSTARSWHSHPGFRTQLYLHSTLCQVRVLGAAGLVPAFQFLCVVSSGYCWDVVTSDHRTAEFFGLEEISWIRSNH